jgi:hypothetical protein
MVDLEQVSPVGRKMIEELRERRARDPRAYVSVADAMLLAGLRETRVRDFIATGVFPVFKDGRSCRIQVAAVYDWMEERIAKSHPAQWAAA